MCGQVSIKPNHHTGRGKRGRERGEGGREEGAKEGKEGEKEDEEGFESVRLDASDVTTFA